MKAEGGEGVANPLVRRRWLIGGGGALLAAMGLGIALMLTHSSPQPDVGTAVGCLAPDFALQNLEGDRIALSDFRGKVVLLVFWQSNCPDCSNALPALRALWAQYRDRGLVLVGVNLDYDPNAVLRYIQEKGYADQITLWESYSAAMAVVELMGVPFVPYTMVIDRRGVIRFAAVYPELPSPADVERWL